MSTESEQLFAFLDTLLDTQAFEDYPSALNGLQVEGGATVSRVAVAVDASEQTIADAVAHQADLLVVHHGLFWGRSAPLTGPLFRKVSTLIRHGVALYSSHLPLDAHPEVGNSALLAGRLELVERHPFGVQKGHALGWQGTLRKPVNEISQRLEACLGGDVRLIPGGPSETERVAVVTGAGSGFLEEAAAAGVDTLVTGEAPHHAALHARELGINLFLGGHYATETFGVNALGAKLEATFGLPWVFLDHPTGL